MIDVKVRNEGTVFAFALRSQAAREWVDENVAEPMMLGSSLVVEWRYARDLALGMMDAGLEVK